VFTILGTFFLSLTSAANISNVGAIIAFSVVSLCVLVLRYREPDRPRPFRIPWCPWVPAFGILSSLFIVYKGIHNNVTVILSFVLWMVLGITIYFGYSHNKTYLNYIEEPSVPTEESDLVEIQK
jgi:APA family basic amino acid/polyamine antiporter